MSSKRIEGAGTHPLRRGRSFTIVVDGESILAYEGETVAAALFASGRRSFRRTRDGEARGIFCGMGVCQECIVMIDGVNVRACVTPATPGAQIDTGLSRDPGGRDE
jgi:D-hydroxyproline dehydrogenase subunit gamma